MHNGGNRQHNNESAEQTRRWVVMVDQTELLWGIWNPAMAGKRWMVDLESTVGFIQKWPSVVYKEISGSQTLLKINYQAILTTLCTMCVEILFIFPVSEYAKIVQN